MRDEEIFEQLSQHSAVPYPGTWLAAPFEDRHVGDRVFAVVATDPGLSTIGVDRASGEPWLLPENDEPSLINSSLEALVACSQVYARAAEEAARREAAGFSDDDDDAGVDDDAAEDPEEDGEDDFDAGDEFTDTLIARFATIDEPAVSDENAFWPVAAEELGYTLPC
ncbi:SUKH-4 family immunity protein [Stackebrandtia endophytica]|nr:SUKH-4 family immunity protein [Stackebrandtia endophytica]